MLEIRTLEIAGLRSVLEALRLPFGKDCRSFTTFEHTSNRTALQSKAVSLYV